MEVGNKVGTIGWIDLTVPNATEVRDFYRAVVGWTSDGVEMDGYDDYIMIPPESEEPATGICHAQGPNADLPPQWLIYINVASLDASLIEVLERGGAIVSQPRDLGTGLMAVIRDPAGAVCALFEPRES